MKIILSIMILVAGTLAACYYCHAFEDDDQGRVKFSLDSLSFLKDSDTGSEGDSARRVSDEPEDEYTYDAMGRKVPVRTLRSGDASPVH